MISEDGEWVLCEEQPCERKFKNHKWGHIQEAEGWFKRKDGRAYCPNHLPEWVAKWRAEVFNKTRR